MFKNYLKIAWRHLRKNKTFSLINVLGLSMGIAFALLTGAYIRGEFLVNNNISGKDRVFLLQSKWQNPDMGSDFTTLAPLAKALQQNYPALVESYYHHDGITSIVSKNNKHFSEALQVGDDSFLKIAGFPLLYGDAATAMQKPNALVITATKAIKYFGSTDVVGQTLSIQSFSGGKQEFEITAVLKDLPQNTITYWGNGNNQGSNEFFLPAASLRFFGRDAAFDSWQNTGIISYVKLKPGIHASQLEAPIRQLIRSNCDPEIQKSLVVKPTSLDNYYLQSNNGLAKRMIYSLGFVALFILLMAIINFVNITIGNSVSRLKEIGVRKVMGSNRTQLIMQFLTESIILAAFSVLIAMLIYIPARPLFGSMLGKQLPFITAFPAIYLAAPVAIALLIGLLAGLYPAFILSRQRSLESLKGKLETVKEKIAFRYTLIGLQFVAAITVFISAIFINKQVDFFFTKDLGYKKDQVITVKVPRDWTPEGVQHMATVRNEFAKLPDVNNVSFSFEIPDGASASSNNNIYKASLDSSHGIIAASLFTDEKFAETYSIQLSAGKFFNANGGTPDPQGIVVNETAVKALGWNDPRAAIGQQVKFQGNPDAAIIGGVVKDFHFGPMQESIRPMYFVNVNNAPLFRYLSFKINTANTGKSLAAIQSKWSVLLPDAPFDFVFMNDTLAKLYATETQMKKASETATVIALIIVLLGVLGIVTQSISKRTKEVGIRKVLGASVIQVYVLFIKEFSFLLLIANLVAWPLSWWFVHKWLLNYAYRIPVNLVPFISVGSTLGILTCTVILLKTLKIASSDPVKSLRTE